VFFFPCYTFWLFNRSLLVCPSPPPCILGVRSRFFYSDAPLRLTSFVPAALIFDFKRCSRNSYPSFTRIEGYMPLFEDLASSPSNNFSLTSLVPLVASVCECSPASNPSSLSLLFALLVLCCRVDTRFTYFSRPARLGSCLALWTYPAFFPPTSARKDSAIFFRPADGLAH